MHPVLIVRGGDPAAVATDVEDLQVAAFGRRRPDQRRTLRQRGHQVHPGLRRVVQPRTRGREQQREADVVGELGPGSDPPRVCGDGQLLGLCRVLLACAAFSFARSDWTAARTPATRARTRSTAAPPSTIRSRRISRACARARSAALRSSASEAAGRRRGTRRSISVSAVLRVGLPVQRAWPAGRRGRARCLGDRGCPRRRRRPRGGARIRWPSTSSSSQPRSRGQARASASWVISRTPSSLVTSRAPTSISIELLVLAGRWRPGGAAPGCGPVRPRCPERPGAGRGRAAGVAGPARLVP